MKRHSLAWILARQWVIFTIGVALLFSGAALLLLFVLEDSFIDRRLREVATQQPAAGAVLPAGFAKYTVDALPPALLAGVDGLAVGNIREFRLPSGRYVHVLLAETGDGTAWLWVHDVTAQLTVTSGLLLLAPGLLVVLLLLALLAWLLAYRFIRRLARRTRALVELAGRPDAPQELRQQAGSEPIRELAELAEHVADAWQHHAAALRSEQQTLAYLAHELRTPMQSAHTSLAQLEDGNARPEVLARLRRALQRLVRATDGVLWLTSNADPRSHETDPGALLQGLAEMFQPLASARNQVISLQVECERPWPGPESALAAVLGNLLLNAIQHGGAGTIVVRASSDCIEVRNRLSPEPGSAGFGLGLQVVDRLCRRCGWLLRHWRDTDSECRELFADPAAAASANRLSID